MPRGRTSQSAIHLKPLSLVLAPERRSSPTSPRHGPAPTLEAPHKDRASTQHTYRFQTRLNKVSNQTRRDTRAAKHTLNPRDPNDNTNF
jgi:hypothetical protein